jgi:hypothetical protein
MNIDDGGHSTVIPSLGEGRISGLPVVEIPLSVGSLGIGLSSTSAKEV